MNTGSVGLTEHASTIRVVQVVMGKFHHFDLARQLHAQGVLTRIYTGYPNWKLRNEGIPRAKIRTFPWLQTLYMARLRLGITNKSLERELAWWCHETLDRYVARNLEPCDVLIALSGTGLIAGRLQKARGGSYVCDRASSHIRFQERMLREEYSLWNCEFEGIDPRGIEREEAEYHEADLITVPSQFAYRSFETEGVPANKLVKIPYGVDLSRFQRVGKPPPERFQVLFVGQLSLRKGLPYLLQAYRQFRHPRKSLVLIGVVSQEIRPFLKTIDHTVQVLGPLPQSELKEWMSRSHVMVLPSIEEGLAYVMAQALACGCPVIASEHTGAEDLFINGQEGFIVKIRDVRAICDRLELLADDTSLQASLSEAALSKVRSIGGWQDYGSKYLQMIVSRLIKR